ncbi:hypothetical protein [Hyphomicrobium sp.]|uniref:hypothetical protein n=1 Tax=Hyphomicrobium sp. TaxID=82 RepID=UPI003F7090BD
MRRHIVPALLIAAALSGCSSGSGVSTASILGTAPAPPAGQAGAVTPVAAIVVPSTPTERAFQVGTVSARAAKCGYNFDAPKLKAAYMAHEIGVGTPTDQMANVEKIYNVAFGGVTKASAEDPNYCSDRKTQEIKADLTRLLAGDFEPPQKAVVAKKKDSGGIFGDFFSSDGEEDNGPKFGSDDWWAKQDDKSGG